MLDCKQSTISKVENGTSVLGIFAWKKFTSMAGISSDVMKWGHIEELTLKTKKMIEEQDNFNIPTRYKHHSNINVRSLLQLINYIKEHKSEEGLLNYLKEIKVRPSFLLYLDNSINLNFLTDFIKYFNINSSNIKDISMFFSRESSHGKFFKFYKESNSHFEVINRYVKSQERYQKLIDFDIEAVGSNEIEVNANLSSGSSLSLFEEGSITLKFLENLQTDNLLNLCRIRKEADNTVSVIKDGSILATENQVKYRLTY
jgi:hypothetical protein